MGAILSVPCKKLMTIRVHLEYILALKGFSIDNYSHSKNSQHQLIKTSLLFGSAPKHAILRVNRKQGEIIKRGLVARTGGVKHLGFAPSSSLLVLQPTPRSTGKKGDKHFNLSSCLILLFTARLSPSWPWKHLSSTNLTEWSAWKPFGQFIKEEC